MYRTVENNEIISRGPQKKDNLIGSKSDRIKNFKKPASDSFSSEFEAIIIEAQNRDILIPSPDELKIMDTYRQELKTIGADEILARLYEMNNTGFDQFSLISWINPSTSPLLLPVNAPLFVPKLGWIGNGIDSYIDTSEPLDLLRINGYILTSDYSINYNLSQDVPSGTTGYFFGVSGNAPSLLNINTYRANNNRDIFYIGYLANIPRQVNIDYPAGVDKTGLRSIIRTNGEIKVYASSWSNSETIVESTEFHQETVKLLARSFDSGTINATVSGIDHYSIGKNIEPILAEYKIARENYVNAIAAL
jgi:hypothetical protein